MSLEGGVNYYQYPDIKSETTLEDYLPLVIHHQAERNDVYVANPMTSYGKRIIYERLFPGQDVSPFMEDIVACNNRFAEANVRLLGLELTGSRVIVPNRIGFVPGFQDLDYMTVCCTVITGYDQDSALKFTELVKNSINPEVFNNHAKSPAAKLASLDEYHKLADICADYFYGLGQKPATLTKTLAIAGHEKSNGTDTELLLATYLEVPIERITYDPHHQDYRDYILEEGPWLDLYEDQSHLSPNGGAKLIYLHPYQHPKAKRGL